MITIVNYGMGNLGSIVNMLKKIGEDAILTSDIDTIAKANKLILPGVGHFDNGMKNLQDFGLIPILNQKVMIEKKPILGICLGMQLMTKGSEEGEEKGLSWIDAYTRKFDFSEIDEKIRIPHMGWNLVESTKENQLMKDMLDIPRYYFVHSFQVICQDPADVLLSCNYGYPFHAAFQHENIFGVQFHPEKSHAFGMKLLKNYAKI